MEPEASFPKAVLVSKTADWLRRLLYERPFLLLSIMLFTGVVIILWHVSRLQSNLVESVTLNNASLYAQALEEFRTLYTSEVAVRARMQGIEVTHDYDVKAGAIPLPATLSLLLGQHIAAKGTGGQPRLYSDYPFPWRQNSGPQDNFEKEALHYLRQHPDHPFTRFEDFMGRPSLRYAKADLMRASCVHCHNTHPDSPKTDWQEGDVRGVLEVILPLDAAVAQSHANVRGTFYLMVLMTAFGLFGLVLVIGEVRRSTAEAQRLAAEAARAHELTQLKSDFVTLVAHELRSPLTTITGYVDLLLEEPVGASAEAQRESLSIVQRNADRLLHLIDDLLDIARIEAGKVELRRTRLDLPGVIQDAAEALRPQIEAKGQRLSIDLAAELPGVSGDADRVTQILTNLLSNAHKYTSPAGTIRISAHPERGRVRIDVQDTGIGLSSDDQAHLFTKFFRAQHRAATGVGGTGLGLAITRALVELHGGDITVTSGLGQGSTFSFTLPAMPMLAEHDGDPGRRGDSLRVADRKQP
jgi:signal transduction histidine kinase